MKQMSEAGRKFLSAITFVTPTIVMEQTSSQHQNRFPPDGVLNAKEITTLRHVEFLSEMTS
jgi:hypothetical protein